MRFYPFGSSSLNPVYALDSIVSASTATYALTARYTIRIRSSSTADTGLPGPNGATGVCTFTAGPQGDPGNLGPAGLQGVTSSAQPYYPLE